jgi:maltose/moltooligosaccharide transporter
MKPKPHLSTLQIINMSMGFLGIQFGFALQNANASRILQTFGANVEHLSWFWIVAPLTGMIVQPIIGHYSDNTWTRMGRRRPYFLIGALLTACAMMLLPNASMFVMPWLPAVFIGAGFLMIMDASINVAMEPFRALVGDMLPDEQSTKGFSIQTMLIGVGAVIGSWLPYILLNWLEIGMGTTKGGVPLNLVYSFFIGAAVLIATIIWTIVTTKEYSPKELAEFSGQKEEHLTEKAKFSDIFKDFATMPKTMKQLGTVQFFSWIALFGMWVYTTPAIAEHIYKAANPSDPAFQEAGNWVGIIFGVYNFVAMIFALALIPIAKKLGKKYTHAIALACGAIGLISIYFINDPKMLIVSMIGVGIAWASILAMPYAILAPVLPAKKMGTYMGLFNFFITIPQIINALFSGLLLRYVFKNIFGFETISMLVLSGVFLLCAAISAMFIKTK